ncbi:MAG: tRNA pseudouridine(55) synthase TruB [Dehalococcoidia bacterium]
MGPSVNGTLNLYKPLGHTSMAVVRRVKRLTSQRGVGHGGTLDPLAEGVLPLCFGQATRVMEYLVNSSKLYRLRVRLGVSTDTFDAEGRVTQERDPTGVTAEKVEQVLEGFRGTIYQTPPMYSALKRQGQRLYALARAGIEVERQPRRVEVQRLELVAWESPEATLEVECGRGMYMRSLAHELGEALGCGAHQVALTRLRTGPFHVEDSVTMERLEAACREATWTELLQPLDTVFLPMKAVVVGHAAEREIRNGQPVNLGPRSHSASHLESWRLYTTEGVFLAVARFDKPLGLWKPQKVFRLHTPSPHAPEPSAP